MSKTCRVCQSDQNGFYKDSSRKDGLENLCKVCSVKKTGKYNKEHPEWFSNELRKGRAKRLSKARQFVIDYLTSHPCIDCGEKDIVVLEFDHVSGIKIENISNMMSNDWPIEDIKSEIAKCVVRCANCHRKKTANQFNWYKK